MPLDLVHALYQEIQDCTCQMMVAEPSARKQGWGLELRGKVATKGNGKRPPTPAWGAGRMDYQAPLAALLGVEMESAVVLP